MSRFNLLAIGLGLALIAYGVDARFYRSHKMRDAFAAMHPCPSTGKREGSCPGYEVDHIQALENGGADEPANMQWLDHEAHVAKTKRDNAEARSH